MRFYPLVLLALWPAVAFPADLSTIDRAVKKEPRYQGTPRYCLLVFGAEANMRIWLVLDDQALYVDRNGNGDLTAVGKRVPLPKFQKSGQPAFEGEREVKAGDISDGKRRHVGLTVSQVRLRKDYKPKTEDEQWFFRLAAPNKDRLLYAVGLTVQRSAGQVMQQAFADRQGFLHFARRRQDAPVVHFDGPLRMELLPGQQLRRNDKAAELRSCIGTQGVGKGSFATLIYSSQPGLVPENVHPIAEIEFPGVKPVKSRVVLKERC